MKIAGQVSLGDVFFLNTQPCVPAATPRRLFAHHSIPAWDVARGPVIEYGSEIGSNKFLLTRPTILVSKLNPRIPRVSLVERIDETTPQCSSTEFISYCARDKDTHLRFYRWFFESATFRRRMISTAKGSTNSQVRTNPGETLGWPCPQPPPFDQNRIAAILDTVDEAIRQTEAVIEKLKKIKQGLLHDLLTRGIGKDGKLRPTPKQAPHLYKDSPLGKIPNEWEVVNMASCSETFAGGTPSRERLDYYGGSIPWVKSAEVNLDEILSTEESLTAKGLRFSSARWIEPNITLIAMYGATAGQVSWLKIRATANQAVLALPLRDSQTNPRWFYWAAKGAMPRIMASVQGSGQPNLSKGVIDMSLISRPLPSEQKAVRDCLDQIADRINTECCVACKFGLIKQGLIEDLLTGRVPVTGLPKDIEKMLD